MEGRTRTISWLKLARKAFDEFPPEVQERMTDALIVAARGEKAGIAKPMKGLGFGVFEIALPYRGMRTGLFMRSRWARISGLSMPSKRNPPEALQRHSGKSISSGSGSND